MLHISRRKRSNGTALILLQTSTNAALKHRIAEQPFWIHHTTAYFIKVKTFTANAVAHICDQANNAIYFLLNNVAKHEFNTVCVLFRHDFLPCLKGWWDKSPLTKSSLKIILKTSGKADAAFTKHPHVLRKFLIRDDIF